MKKMFLFLMLFSIPKCPGPVYGQICSIEMKDADVRIVEIYVEDAEKWLREAWAKKVEDRKEELIDSCIKKLRSEKKSIPADDEKILKKCLDLPQFNTRKERDKLAKEASLATQ